MEPSLIQQLTKSLRSLRDPANRATSQIASLAGNVSKLSSASYRASTRVKTLATNITSAASSAGSMSQAIRTLNANLTRGTTRVTQFAQSINQAVQSLYSAYPNSSNTNQNPQNVTGLAATSALGIGVFGNRNNIPTPPPPPPSTPPPSVGGTSGGGMIRFFTTILPRILARALSAITLAFLYNLDRMMDRFQDVGMSASASIARSLESMRMNLTSPFRTGTFFGMPLTELRANLFGKLNFQENPLLDKVTGNKDILDLLRLNVSPDAIANIGIRTMQQGNFNPQTSIDFMTGVEKQAAKMGANIGTTLNDIGTVTDLLINSANMIPDSFAKSVIELKRMNVEMKNIEGFSDRITSDFDAFLTAQAELQVFLPGADLTNFFLASQFGGMNEQMGALRGVLGGRKIESMPRSVRNAISRTMGLPLTDIIGLEKGPMKGEVKRESETGFEMVKDVSVKLANSFLRLAVAATAATAALFGMTGPQLKKFLIGSVTGGVGSVVRGGLFKRMLAGSLIAGIGTALSTIPDMIANKSKEGSTTHRVGKFASRALQWGSIGAGIGSMFAPGIGTAVGGYLGVLGAGIASKFEKHHSGGVVGKKAASDDVPAILQRGEGVLTKQQLSSLTRVVDSVRSLGTIGDTISKSIRNFDVTKIKNSVSSVFSDKGGIFSNIKNSISGILTPLKENFSGIKNVISSATDGGGLKGIASKLLGGEGGGLKGIASKLLGGTEGGGLKGIASKLLGGEGGGLKTIASSVLKKIPGGGIISSVMGGGGIKNIASNITKNLSGAKLGAMIGSVIPGAGTLLGGVVGNLLSGKAGELANKAKAAVKKIGAKVGGFFGGLFGKKKKPTANAVVQGTSIPQQLPTVPNTSTVTTGTSPQQITSTQVSGTTQSSDITNKLDELIGLMRNIRWDVTMDGKKVGEGIVNAYSRG